MKEAIFRLSRPIFLLCLFPLLLPASVLAEVRTWTNRNGQQVEAEYLSHDDNQVTIRRTTDDQEFQFPIRVLSQPDQEWLASRGEGIYIAVGNGAHRMSSLDGIVWTNHVYIDEPGHDQNDIKDIAVGNEACVAVGGYFKSNIFVTNDGVEWEKNPFNMGVLSGVIFHDDRFIAFGEGGRIAASSKGEEWEEIGDAGLRDHLDQEAKALGEEKRIKSNIRSWAESGGTFVGSGDNGFLIVTQDFEDWQFPPRIEPRSRLYIAADDHGFVVKGKQTLHHSPDGLTWTEVTPDIGDEKFRSIVHDGERFLTNTSDKKGWASSDGVEWELIEDATFPDHLAALRPDLYYSFQNYWKYTKDLLRSTDGGETWESCQLPAPAGITHMIYAEGFPAFPALKE